MRAGERTGEITRERTQDQRGTTDALCAGNHAALEQLFRARAIAFLVEAGFLTLWIERACCAVGCIMDFKYFKSTSPSKSAHRGA